MSFPPGWRCLSGDLETGRFALLSNAQEETDFPIRSREYTDEFRVLAFQCDTDQRWL
jgi:hypothetical protein